MDFFKGENIHMKRCIKILINVENAPRDFLTSVCNNARTVRIEGTAQLLEKQLTIIACGKTQDIESFLDFLHAGYKGWFPDIIEEPFLLNKDYRGIFRIIE